jgi:peptidoglycan/LPS O-acetylase OafA/YrhL
MRNLGLDLVRFFAVFLVLLRHADVGPLHSSTLELLQYGGWVGVDLFFVLSGFLVSSLLFKEYKSSNEINLGRFLIGRAFKIYPSFWLLVLFYGLFLFLVKRPPSFFQIAHEILFVQNYLPGFLGFTWSLAIEEHFYVGLALLFAALRKLRKSKMFDSIPITFLLISVTCLVLRIYYIGPAHVFSIFPFSYFTHLRMDSLFFGVFLSYFYHFRSLQQHIRRIPSLVFVVVGIILLAPAFLVSPYTHRWLFTWGFVLLYLGSGAIILGAITFERSKNTILVFLGEIGMASYSIYLWHLPFKELELGLLQKLTHTHSPIFFFSVYLFGSFFAGWLMNRWFEQPIHQFREKLFNRGLRSFSFGNSMS